MCRAWVDCRRLSLVRLLFGSVELWEKLVSEALVMGGGNGLIMVFTLIEAGSVEEVVEKESAKASAAIGFVKIAEFVS